MKIAIDIDNTLINYEGLFLEASKREGLDLPNSFKKNDIKEYIREQGTSWPEQWIRIQGHCYGDLIKNAPYFNNAIESISKWIDLGHHIQIISHKTELSLCQNYNLHTSCLERMDGDFSNIMFFDTLKDKVNYVNKNNFDVVIDDLSTVLNLVDSNILRLHFTEETLSQHLSFLSWTRVDELISAIPTDIFPIENIKKVGKQTYQLTSKKQKYFLKLFTDLTRFQNELTLLDILDKEQIYHPRPLAQLSNGFIYKDTEALVIKDFSAKFCADYTNTLRKLNTSKHKFNSATHCVSHTSHYLLNIENRLSSYSGAYLEKFTNIFDHLKSKKITDQDIKTIICQPDMFKDNFAYKDGELYLYDFESFGSDDPVRMIFNAIHHNGHSITLDEATSLYLSVRELSHNHELFNYRFRTFFDCSALEWLIIISNQAEMFNDAKKLNLVHQLTDKMTYNLNNSKNVWSWQGEIYDRILKIM